MALASARRRSVHRITRCAIKLLRLSFGASVTAMCRQYTVHGGVEGVGSRVVLTRIAAESAPGGRLAEFDRRFERIQANLKIALRAVRPHFEGPGLACRLLSYVLDH